MSENPPQSRKVDQPKSSPFCSQFVEWKWKKSTMCWRFQAFIQLLALQGWYTASQEMGYGGAFLGHNWPTYSYDITKDSDSADSAPSFDLTIGIYILRGGHRSRSSHVTHDSSLSLQPLSWPLPQASIPLLQIFSDALPSLRSHWWIDSHFSSMIVAVKCRPGPKRSIVLTEIYLNLQNHRFR